MKRSSRFCARLLLIWCSVTSLSCSGISSNSEPNNLSENRAQNPKLSPSPAAAFELKNNSESTGNSESRISKAIITFVRDGHAPKTVKVSSESEVEVIRKFISSHLTQHSDTNAPSPPHLNIQVLMADGEELEVSYCVANQFFYANGTNGYLTPRQSNDLDDIINIYFSSDH